MPLKRDTGESIRALRKRLHLGQKNLAFLLGVTVTSISRYENGQEPRGRVLLKLANLAAGGNLPEFERHFLSKRECRITSVVARLASAGTGRRIPLRELAAIQALCEAIRRERFECQVTGKANSQQVWNEVLRKVDRIVEIVAPYLTETVAA